MRCYNRCPKDGNTMIRLGEKTTFGEIEVDEVFAMDASVDILICAKLSESCNWIVASTIRLMDCSGIAIFIHPMCKVYRLPPDVQRLWKEE